VALHERTVIVVLHEGKTQAEAALDVGRSSMLRPS
jgi:hypothetical protein